MDEVWVAQLPDVFGYGVTAYGKTTSEAETQCRKEWRRNDQGPNSGWDTHTRTWKETKEWYGFRVFKVKVPSASLTGCEKELT